jgi:hypothetical protein
MLHSVIHDLALGPVCWNSEKRLFYLVCYEGYCFVRCGDFVYDVEYNKALGQCPDCLAKGLNEKQQQEKGH